MSARLIDRFLAVQFARPRGLAGRWIFGWWLDRVNQAMNRLVLQQLELGRDDRVLDVGFGGGNLLASILESQVPVAAGADLSREMVARGRRRFRRDLAQGRLRLVEASAERLPFEDGAFDKACSVHTIYFWQDPGAVMEELARVIRAGGTLILGFEAAETLRQWPGHQYGFTVYEPDEVVQLAERHAFRTLSIVEGTEPKFGPIFCARFERF